MPGNRVDRLDGDIQIQWTAEQGVRVETLNYFGRRQTEIRLEQQRDPIRVIGVVRPGQPSNLATFSTRALGVAYMDHIAEAVPKSISSKLERKA